MFSYDFSSNSEVHVHNHVIWALWTLWVSDYFKLKLIKLLRKHKAKKAKIYNVIKQKDWSTK